MINLDKVMMDSRAMKDIEDRRDFIERELKEYYREEIEAEKIGTVEDVYETLAYLSSLTSEQMGAYEREENAKYLQRTKSENECEKLLTQLNFMLDQTSGVPRTEEGIRLSTFRNEYCRLFKGKHRDSTITTKRDAMNAFIAVVGDIFIDEVRVKTIDSFFAVKRQKEGASPVYLNALLRSLRPVFEQAKAWEYISKNPFKGIKKFPEWECEKRKHMSLDELNVLLSMIPDKHSAYRDMFVFLAGTGMRREEMVLLEWRDVNEEFKEITIRKEKGYRSRTIPIGDVAFEIIKKRRADENGSYVFHIKGRQRDEDHVSKEFLKYRRAAGLDEKITLHSLRHMAATVMRDGGIPMEAISKILGHCNTQVTQNIYVHASIDHLHKAITALNVLPSNYSNNY